MSRTFNAPVTYLSQRNAKYRMNRSARLDPMKRNGVINGDRLTDGTAATRGVDDCKTQNGGLTRDENPAALPGPDIDEDCDLPIARAGTLSRTKTLFFAAVRLWELKRGLRNN